jgi:hypothetical protein
MCGKAIVNHWELSKCTDDNESTNLAFEFAISNCKGTSMVVCFEDHT